MPSDDPPADASTLIYLAKADRFAAAARCVERIRVPPSVWHEAVVEGERIGASEVPRIREAADHGFLARTQLSTTVQEEADRIRSVHNLGLGESEVLALADRGGLAVVDEGRAARVARALGILPVSTLFLPVLALRRGTMHANEATDFLRHVAVVAGARAEVVFEIRRIEEYR